MKYTKQDKSTVIQAQYFLYHFKRNSLNEINLNKCVHLRNTRFIVQVTKNT